VQTLFSNTTGSDNTATGRKSLFNNTIGNQNTAHGDEALFHNTTGSNNTATGHDTLQSNTTGSSNTADGEEALINNTTGTGNTADGVGALSSNTTGNNNIALGNQAGVFLTTGDNNIDIGNQGVGGDDSTIRIGTEDIQLATFIAGIYGATTGSGTTLPVIVDSNGQLGTAASSERFKTEIRPMDKSSESLLALKPATFHYKNDSKGTRQFGLIAEEVASVNPDLVVRDRDGQIYTVRYEAVNAMLLNEFLKEHKKVEKQDREIQQQRATISELKKCIATVMAHLQEQDAKIQKVSDQIELNKAGPEVTTNDFAGPESNTSSQ